MRLLIVTPLLPPEPGGPSYYSVALKDALENKGETVTLKAFRDVRHLPSGVRHLVFLWQVYRLARRADALIILDTVSVALPAVLAAKFARKPSVIRTGGDFVWEHFVERTKEKVLLSRFYAEPRQLSFKERALLWLQRIIVFRYVDRIAYSTAWQRGIWRTPYSIDDSKTVVIENSCPQKVPATEPGHGAETGPVVCAWRPTAFKNIPALELALQDARGQDPAVRIDFLRGVPRDELYNRLRTARALFIPSLSEVSPNMALEALSYGVPVVLTQDCGMKKRLGDAVTYIDTTDTQALGKALLALYDDATYEEILARAQAFSYARSYDDLADDFMHVLTQL